MDESRQSSFEIRPIMSSIIQPNAQYSIGVSKVGIGTPIDTHTPTVGALEVVCYIFNCKWNL